MRMRAEIAKRKLAGTWRRCAVWSLGCVLGWAFGWPGPIRAQIAGTADAEKAEQLDGVIAVVNNQVILASDLDLEMRVFRLLPIGDRIDSTPVKALERLTTRALIEQQIAQEDPHGLDVAPNELADALAELRQNLPACKSR